MLHQLATNLGAGLLAGLLGALGGTVKDAPHEGFKPRVFLRSPILGALWGLVSFALTTDVFLAFAFADDADRITVEGRKILRAKVPGKFATGGSTAACHDIDQAAQQIARG